MPLYILAPILIALFGLMAGVFLIFLFASEDFNFLSIFYMTGLGLRIFLSFLFYFISFVFYSDTRPGYLLPMDGWLYSEQGWQICKLAEKAIAVTKENFLFNPNIYFIGHKALSGNITSYDFFASHVYSIFDYNPLSLFFIGSVASALAALFVYFIAKELFSKNVARIAVIFAFFWPSFILWSTQNLKEPMIILFVAILLWSIFYIRKFPSPLFLILPSISIWVLSKIGIFYLSIILGALFFVLLFLLLNVFFKNNVLKILVIFLLAYVFYIFFKDKILQILIAKGIYSQGDFKSVFEFLNFSRTVRAHGNLQFLKDADISSVGGTISFLPVGLFYVLFSPFPWQLGSLAQIIVIPETILYYLTFPFAIKGIVFAYKKRFNQSILLIFIIAGMLFFLALIEGNSGTLFRHRSIPFYLLFIFTSIGLSLKKWKFGIIYKC